MERALIGETFYAIIVYLFTRLGDGAPCWYEDGTYFLASPVILDDLGETNLADIFRRNTPLDDVIPGVGFKVPAAGR